MNLDLEPIRERANEELRLQQAATPGPWLLTDPGKETEGPAAGFSKGVIVAAVCRGQYVYAIPNGGVSPECDRALIAHARTSQCASDALALIAEIKRLRAVEAAARVAHDEFAALASVLYGQNHDVLGWHQNGDVESFDNFYDDNIGGDTLRNLDATLKGAQS